MNQIETVQTALLIDFEKWKKIIQQSESALCRFDSFVRFVLMKETGKIGCI